MAPVLAFTSEEIWRYIPGNKEGAISVQLTGMPGVVEEYLDEELDLKWERLLEVRGEVTKALETARRDKVIGNSLEAAVELYAGEDLYNFLKPLAGDLAVIFIVSGASLKPLGEAPGSVRESEHLPGLAVTVRATGGRKCERCWVYHEDVGADAGHPVLCPKCVDALK